MSGFVNKMDEEKDRGRMTAYVLHGVQDIRLESVPVPVPKEGEVVIEVRAAGICGSDIPRIYQTGAHVHPLVPGHEFSGVAVSLGAGVDTKWQGQRVGVFPLIPCRSCQPCRMHQYEMCRDYSYLGSRKDGGFAAYVAAPADNLIQLAESVSFEEAAMLEPMAVAVHAMRRIMPAVRDTVAVYGLGTIGLLLLMFLKEAGIKNLCVIGNKEFQKQMVLKLGLPADAYCDSKVQDVGQWLMERTDGLGADVFFECIGKDSTYAQAVDYTAPAGKVCLVGNPHTDMNLEKQVYWKILRNQLTVTGTWNSSFTGAPDDDWHYALDRLIRKRVSPSALISHRLSFGELQKGLHIMRDKTEDYVKIMGIF